MAAFDVYIDAAMPYLILALNSQRGLGWGGFKLSKRC